MRTKQNIAASLTEPGIYSILVHAGLLLLMAMSYWLSQNSMADSLHRPVVYSPIDLVTIVERTEQSATEIVQAPKTTDVIPVRAAAFSKEITAAVKLTEAIKRRRATEVATSVANKIPAPNSEAVGTSNDKLKKTDASAALMTQQAARPDHAYNPKPDYPVALRDRGLSGVVWLRVWVDAAGRPREIELAKGSGYRLFDESALRAVQQWRFIPAKNEHQSLASWVEFAVRFVING